MSHVRFSVLRRWVVDHLQRAAVLVEHDLLMAATSCDRTVRFTGIPGVECTASSPTDVPTGLNGFLADLGVTMRADESNGRPRINKRGGAKDREQKASGIHYSL